MGMSYRRTWLLVDALNRCWRERVVETVPGGSHERGARLTDFGRAVLRSYRGLEARLAEAAGDPSFAELLALLREEPAPAQQRSPATPGP